MSALANLDKAIETKKFEPVYIFTGEETGLISLYLSEIKKLFKNVIVTEDIEMIIEDSKYNSIFGGNKLYILQDTGLFNKKADDKFIEFLASMLIKKNNVCIFVEKKIDERLRQTQALKKDCIITFNQLNEAQLIALVKQVCEEQYGKKFKNKDIIRYFVDLCDYSYNIVINELTKLANYVEGNIIDLDHVKTVVSKSTSAVIFDLVTYIVQQRYDRAFDMFETLILRKESPLVMLTLMYRQFKLLYQIKVLMKDGFTNINDIAEACETKPFIIEKNMKLCNFDDNKLLKLIEKCSQYDYDIKRGKIQDTLAIKSLIIYSAII